MLEIAEGEACSVARSARGRRQAMGAAGVPLPEAVRSVTAAAGPVLEGRAAYQGAGR